MSSRRQFLVVLGSAAVIGPLAMWFTRPSMSAEAAAAFPVQKSDEEWRALLTSGQYRVLRGHSTERPNSSPLDNEHRAGIFACAACGNELFSSDTKFESGTGWPSFWRPLPNAVGTTTDRSWLMVRTEVHCADCGSHLGHVFDDGPRPTGLRYCMNGIAMKFIART